MQKSGEKKIGCVLDAVTALRDVTMSSDVMSQCYVTVSPDVTLSCSVIVTCGVTVSLAEMVSRDITVT